jgi:hypothetical protein
LALVVDPRFSGGTGAAVAAEIRALAGAADLSVVAVETAMFKGRRVHPAIEAALEDTGLALAWNPPVVRADTIVFHNPSCLRFDVRPPLRISCAQAIVVTHENFLRPNGSEGFDVAGCLALLERALVCGARRLAPVSAHNRRTVEAWLARERRDWLLADEDWFNILDGEHAPPNPRPRDRRGRHSRPGLEKFPPMEIMRAHFPAHAERCMILGADALLAAPEPPPAHWDLRKFGETEVARFLEEIDFFVYFTHPNWRESFGRVVAEAIAAGKLVITDPGTAKAFGDAVVATDGGDVDALVAGFVADPARYAAFVRAAQASLARFAPAAFLAQALRQVAALKAERHALV